MAETLSAERTSENRRSWGAAALRAYVGLYMLYVLLPIAIIVLYAFNSTRYLIWPPAGLSFQWFEQALSDHRLIDAFTNSMVIAFATMILCTVLGLGFAYGLVRYKFRGKTILETFNLLPIITYGVISGLSLLLLFRTAGLPTGVPATIIGHTVFIMPFAVLMIVARLTDFDTALEDAAMDLGAKPLRTFFDITLPLILPAVMAAALFSFTLSLDEFIIAFFLIGNELTLPVYLFAMMRFSFTPAVNAIATIIIGLSVLLVAMIGVFFKRVDFRF
jgi:spermidine/putrescine transport system permease protein